MDLSGLQRAREIFDAVADLPPDERQAALRDLCGSDTALRVQVEGLLAYDEEASTSQDVAALVGATPVDVARDVGELELQLTPGIRVGRYTVLEEIGCGGMGVVCAAYDPNLDRKVALKLVRSAAAGGAHRALEHDARLLREAQGLARLSHPNVVTVYDSGVWRGRLYVAMDFIDGRNLRDWLRDESPELEQRIAVLRAAGRGLAAAHDAGLLHRDFKPENVMLGPGDRVRVVDFGLVRPLAEAQAEPATDDVASTPGGEPEWSVSASALDSPLTRVGSVIGTPAFIAPEVLRGEPVDGRSDQFSFCVALYEAVYDRLPAGPRGSLATLRRTWSGELDPPAPSGPAGRVPSWLRAVLERGLRDDPGQRFDDLHQVVAALGHGERLRRRRQSALVVAAALVLAATGAAWSWWRGMTNEALCRGESRMAEVWDAEDAAALRASAASEEAWAGATGDAIVRLLDRRAADWVAEYRDACEATHVRGEQSEQLLDLRMACLEQRRREVGALASLLASPGDSSLESHLEAALHAAGSLSPLADCRDTAVLRATTDLPPDAASREHIETARGLLAEARVRRLAEDLGAAAESLAAASRIAQDQGWQPLLAESAYEAARLADAESRFDASYQHFQEALRAATRSRHDRLAARALAGLAWADGYRREAVARGSDWQQLAHSLVARLGERTDLEHDLGTLDAALAFAAGDLDAAAARWRVELDWHRQTLGAAHPQTLDLMLRLAGVLENLGRTDEALALVDEQHALIVGQLGAGHPLLGYNLAQRGNFHFRTGDLAAAESDFRAAVTILEAAYGRRHVRTATALNNLAWVLFRSDRQAAGVALQEEVLELQTELWGGAHPDVALAYGNLAEMHLALADHDRAIELAERGLEAMRRAVGDDDPAQLVSATSMLGYTLFHSGRPRHAIAPLEETLRLAAGRLPPRQVTGARFLLARAYRDAGLEPDRARDLALTARRDAEDAGQSALVAQIDRWLAGG